MDAPFFNHDGLHFRVPDPGDIKALQDLRNDESTWIHLKDPKPIGPADQKAWFDSIGWKNGRMYLAVYDAKNPFVGLVYMDELDLQNRSMRIGANVVPELRNQGYGKKIYAALKIYAFEQLNLHRLWLCVLETNTFAIQVYEKCGFKVEGRYREAIYRNGKYVDYILMSCLEHEYRRK